MPDDEKPQAPADKTPVKPVDKGAQEEAAEERKDTGGYQ